MYKRWTDGQQLRQERAVYLYLSDAKIRAGRSAAAGVSWRNGSLDLICTRDDL